MTNQKTYTSLLFLSLIIILSVGLVAVIKGKNNKTQTQNVNIDEFGGSNNSYIDTTTYFDYDLFKIGLNKQNFVLDNTGVFRLGVIPHHTLPSHLISKALSNTKAKTIILLGPDHKNILDTPFVINNVSFNTYFGVVKTNHQIVGSLKVLLGDKVKIANKVIKNEHSVVSVAPYIKYHAPNASLVTIVVSPKASYNDLQTLANTLNTVFNDEVAIITAIDFSHYLTTREAEQKDTLTKNLILTNDTKNIYGLNSDYLDDPNSLITVLKIASINNLKPNIINYTNSGYLTKKPNGQTTSYFLINFTQ